MHCFYLLFSLYASVIQSLVLLFNSSDFFFDFLFPIFSFTLFSLWTFIFKFSNFIKFSFFFHFKNGLFNGLSEQNVQNRLNFSVIIKQIIILNLSDFIDTSLLWYIRRGGRLALKLICLNLYVDFICSLFALFS